MSFKAHIAIHLSIDGCALAFAYNEQITVYNKWKTKKHKRVHRIPTEILLNNEDDVIAFGSKAKTMYSNLAGRERREWKFIEKIKLSLHGKELHSVEKLYDDNPINDDWIHANDANNVNDIIGPSTHYRNIVHSATEICSQFMWIPSPIKQSYKQNKKILKKVSKEYASAAYQWTPSVCKPYISYVEHQIHEDLFYILATNGEKCSANIVFVTVFQHLQQIAKEYLAKHCDSEMDINDNEIQYIFTVPTIWNMDKIDEQIKEWMIAGGLIQKHIENQCKIVYESDCAALEIYKEHQTDGCFVVIHLGGSNVDIAYHEIVNDKCFIIEQTHKQYNYFMNNAYTQLLDAIFGKENMKEFKIDSPNVFMEMMDNFHHTKHTFNKHTLYACDAQDVELPFEFMQFLNEKDNDFEGNLDIIRRKPIQFFQCLFGGASNDDIDEKEDNESNENMEELLQKDDEEDEFSDALSWILILSDEKLIIDSAIWKTMLNVDVDEIVDDLDALLLYDTKQIYLVGDNTCFSYYEHKIKQKYKEVQVMIPLNPNLTVAKGAAYYGITDPLVVVEGKILSHSYAIKDKNDCLSYIMRKNQRIPIGHTEVIHIATDNRNDHTIIPILKSDDAQHWQQIKSFEIYHEKRHKEVRLEMNFNEKKIVVYYYLSHAHDRKYDKKCEIVHVDLV